jgi:hypothetical protein
MLLEDYVLFAGFKIIDVMTKAKTFKKYCDMTADCHCRSDDCHLGVKLLSRAAISLMKNVIRFSG